ncbi:hypothetical protein A2U01_0030349, partial [Trifolium medium]|nr:hypothetical protein [Trifolium medium]
VKPSANLLPNQKKGGESEKRNPTITSITGGPSNPKGWSGGTTKRKIAEMCSVRTNTPNNKEGGRPMIGFNDDEYLGDNPNEIFPLIIIATMACHDVSSVLIDQGSSCNVMYQELFERLGLKKKNLHSYEGTDLQGFNGSIIRPWGFINLPFTFENKEIRNSKKTVTVQFLVIQCNSVYNCILGRPTLAALGAVPSTVHMKMKYHNDKGEVVTIEADMVRAKKCHQTMQKVDKATTVIVTKQAHTNGSTSQQKTE